MGANGRATKDLDIERAVETCQLKVSSAAGGNIVPVWSPRNGRVSAITPADRPYDRLYARL
ncbi:hypothetical protein PR003_g14318 [Phytophthora rubi]|uniref:Uncharacterized protein n=1 Tax=Phytophthora rubi TaxID=129364 RepID=A0A6A4F3B3_9STRA|nr:hypothetical protein PR003_g14318 [Phytophthora rubi]